MIDSIKKFNREVSLERFQSHSTNTEVQIAEFDATKADANNVWSCGILWGNEDIKGLIIVKFTTLNILAMSSNIFKNTNDNMLFEYTKDFMKEYCNFYAGFIKGTFNNQKIDISLSLPIISNTLSPMACLGGDNKDCHLDQWILQSGGSEFEVHSYVKLEDGIKNIDTDFLTESKEQEKKSSIEFF